MSSGERTERRVLLVDHTDRLDRFLRDALVEAGFDVETVASAGECLASLQRTSVDAIVSAYALPKLDGLKLLRSVRVSYPTLPFVLVPESGSETLAGDAVAAGVTGYAPRDADAETVLGRVRDALHRGGPRREAESEHQQRYRHLIEMSPAAINIFDENGNSLWCNQAVVELLDLDSRADLIGRSIFDVIHPESHDVARAEMEAIVDRKEPTGPTQMKLRTLDGDVRYIRVSTTTGSFLGAEVGQAIAIDVTDREVRTRQLQVLDQWLRHNIRNEASIVLGIAEDLQESADPAVRESADKIAAHSERLVEQADIERSIVDLFSRDPNRGEHSIDLGDVVERQARACRDDHPDADIEVMRADDCEVRAIPELEAAVAELVRNAVRHSDVDSSTVRIESRCREREGVVRVADDGPGIPPDERAHLPLDREISQLNHGSGMGLVFVYWVCRLSGGDIAFSENDPRGSVVTLTFERTSAE